MSINLNVALPTSVFKVLNLRHSDTLKIFPLLVLIVMIGYFAVVPKPSAAATSQVQLWVNPAAPAVGEGEIFNVSIQVDNLPSPDGAVGFEVILGWDPAIVQGISMTDMLYQSIAPSDNIWKIRNIINNVDGNAYYAYTFQDILAARDDGYAPISGNHTLATITLKGIGTGWSNLTFQKITVGGYNFGTDKATVLPSIGIGGTVVVGNPPPVIRILSPLNDVAYNTTAVNLTVAISKPVPWIAYSLDKGTNVAITANITIPQVSEGQHNIVVYANDSVGQMGSSEKINFTVAVTPPTASFTITPPTPQAETVFGVYRWTAFFNASASQGHFSNVTAYFWDFGDGTNATDIAVAHDYNDSGTYNVRLTVTDNAGNFAATVQTLNLSAASGAFDIPLGLIGAIVVPVVWVPLLGYYLVRMKRKRKKT
jgi:chitodextrinase